MTKTEIRFVAGFDPACWVPDVVTSAGLGCRFAVIQETCRPDKADMYFDDALWRRVLEFASKFVPGSTIEIIEHEKAAAMRPADFLATWSDLSDEDKSPPGCSAVREHGRLVLCISTEYWNQAGGPWPYHDSYTYAIYSNEDVSELMVKFLREAEMSDLWDIASEVLEPSPEIKPFWRVWLGKLFG